MIARDTERFRGTRRAGSLAAILLAAIAMLAEPLLPGAFAARAQAAGSLASPPPSVPLAAAGSVSACTGWTSQDQPPTTIRVYRTKTDAVSTVDFRAYVRKVVVNEFARSWPFQLLAVGAIVAKQNAWYWTMHGRDWSQLQSAGSIARPIQQVTLPDGTSQWQTTAGSASGAGLCWDLTDDPAIDQCYDCEGAVDPASGPRNQAAVDATWGISLRRPRGGVESFFAPAYAGRKAATCPPMATQADWESWFTGAIDFNQALVCASANGESAVMLLRRFLSSALQIHDPGTSDLTGDGIGDIPILRAIGATAGTGGPVSGGSGVPASAAEPLVLDPASADPAFVATAGAVPPPALASDPGPTVARAVGRLGRQDRASLVSASLDAGGNLVIAAQALDGPGALSQATWWTGQVAGLDPASTFSLSIADATGDLRPDVVLLERAKTIAPDGTAAWSLTYRVLATTDSGPDPRGFVAWADLGPFAAPTRFERAGDVDGDGRLDLVFAPGDAPGFLVARAARDGSEALTSPVPYGDLAVPANPDDWRYFALADVQGTGVDEPVIAATGGAAQAAAGAPVPLAILDAPGSAYPTDYAIALSPLTLRWSATDPSAANALLWTGNSAGDGFAQAAIIDEGAGLPVTGGGAGSPALTLIQVGTGAPASSVPPLGPGTLAEMRIVAPGDQRALPPDATLRALRMDHGTLSPAFDPATATYVVVVPTAVKTIRVRPATNRTWARMTVNHATVASGKDSAPIPLRIGSTVVRIVVADGRATSTYTVTVVRADRPSAPRITKLVPVAKLRARVYWAASGNGGSPVTGWVVRWRRLGTTTWTTIRLDAPATRAYTFSGLAKGRTYQVQVIARTLAGVGVPSASVTVVASK